MIKVAINGFGTIGKRVADAVAAQPDMEVVGVSKTRPSAEAYIANQRGYPLYIADISKRDKFEKVGIAVAGDIEEMLKHADIVVDATPGGVGAKNRPLYELYNLKAIWQGGEDHEVAGFSFNSSCNFEEARGKDFVRVVSCNTTGLCRIINLMDKAFGVKKVRATMVRRGSDPGGIKKGPVDAVVLNPVTIPSHHGPDVQTVLPRIDIVTLAMIVPTTFRWTSPGRPRVRRSSRSSRAIRGWVSSGPEPGSRAPPSSRSWQATWDVRGPTSGRTASTRIPSPWWTVPTSTSSRRSTRRLTSSSRTSMPSGQ
jgi:glyceraldehyde-3-phosphate dehydrogenase (NAD(P))